MLKDAIRRAREGRDAAESDFFEELGIPSVSTLPEHRADVRRNATWLAERFDRLGFRTELTDVIADGHPVLSAERLVDPAAPILTIYGHYDVQPADPIEEWVTPPFEPTVRDGAVFARGASDNKGNHMAALTAAAHTIAAGGPHANLRFLIEGEEEIGGSSLPEFVRANAESLRSDYVLIWDGGFSPEGTPALVTGLRGILYVQLEARGPAHDLHSGTFGGIAPNPLNTLARIVGELKDREGTVTIPGFYEQVLPPTAAEIKGWERPPGYAQRLLTLTGASHLEGERGYPLTQREWTRPTLDAHGFMAGFTGEGKKTVIPARAMAKVSMRLVPDQDPDRIFESLVRYVRQLTTPGVTVEVQMLSKTRPALFGTDHPGVHAASSAFESAFGAPALLIRSGGSIPVALDIKESLKAHMLVSGLAQPDSGAHSPNEKFDLEHFHKGVEMLIHLMYGLPAVAGSERAPG